MIEKARRERLALPVLLVLVVAVVYLPVTSFEFMNYDDASNIQSPLGNDFSLANLVRFWSRPYEGLYIPLTYTIWGLLAALGRAGGATAFNPLLFHLANLLLHITSTLVVFYLLRRLFSNTLGAAAGALVFAVHPIQVEAVAWATGMKDLLAGCLTFVVLDSYVRHLESPFREMPWRSRYYALASLGMAAAVLAKPSAVVVPVMAGVMACFMLRRPFYKVIRELAPWLFLVLPVVLLTKLAQPGLTMSFVPSFGQRFLVAGDALSFYLGKLLWPLKLGIDYGRPPEYVLSHEWIYLTGLLPYLVGAGLLFLAWRRRQTWPLVVAGFMVIPLLPVLGFVSFIFQVMSTVADRYLYTAMLGPAMLVCWLVGCFRTNKLIMIGITGILLCLAGLSVMQLKNWRNSYTLAIHALQLNPDSVLANHNLGQWYVWQGRYDLALAYYSKVLALRPEYSLIHYSLGELYQKLQRPEEALAAYRKVAEITPGFGGIDDRMGMLYVELGRLEEALVAFRKAVAADQPQAVSHLAELQGRIGRNLAALEQTVVREPGNGEALRKLGELLILVGRKQEALAVYRELLRVRPEDVEAQRILGRLFCELRLFEEAKELYLRAGKNKDLSGAYNEVGLTCLELGRPDEAVSLYLKSVALRPDSAEAHANLGVAFRQLGKTTEAIAAYRKAISLNPGLVDVYLDLGYLFASLGQDGEAVTLYRRAAEINPGNAVPPYALGRHWLERGRFDEARSELEKSLRADPDFVPTLASLSLLYRKMDREDLAADYEKLAMHAKYGDEAKKR